jgi:hypothetical protein
MRERIMISIYYIDGGGKVLQEFGGVFVGEENLLISWHFRPIIWLLRKFDSNFVFLHLSPLPAAVGHLSSAVARTSWNSL